MALDPGHTGGNSLTAVIAGMKKAWSEVFREDTFDYQFQDETRDEVEELAYFPYRPCC